MFIWIGHFYALRPTGNLFNESSESDALMSHTQSKIGFECLICRMTQNKILVTSIFVADICKYTNTHCDIEWWERERKSSTSRIVYRSVYLIDIHNSYVCECIENCPDLSTIFAAPWRVSWSDMSVNLCIVKWHSQRYCMATLGIETSWFLHTREL